METLRLSDSQIADFQNTVLKKGEELYREMPWRTDTRPYYVLLSEIMLQQTQVPRVLQKFTQFVEEFPTLESLATADFQQVLALWSGLGYNRRAKFLHQAAKYIVDKGAFPTEESELVKCPGIGENTAASIVVYAYNKPLVFLETNVRTVLIYSFFQNRTEKIDERILKDVAQRVLYTENPRKWYWALMDYGTELKKTVGNFNKFSQKHTTQSRFEGSFRQKRAATLRLLLHNGPLALDELAEQQNYSHELIQEIVASLQHDALITEINGRFCIVS
ncbi:MAG: hypothetical protein IK117_07000 [Bacteroidales bacterium]|nr:hypothetical protein [Bacteroidales bacterium]